VITAEDSGSGGRPRLQWRLLTHPYLALDRQRRQPRPPRTSPPIPTMTDDPLWPPLCLLCRWPYTTFLLRLPPHPRRPSRVTSPRVSTAASSALSRTPLDHCSLPLLLVLGPPRMDDGAPRGGRRRKADGAAVCRAAATAATLTDVDAVTGREARGLCRRWRRRMATRRRRRRLASLSPLAAIKPYID